MAKLGNSTFGGFVGKLGNVVGYNRKGVWCVRTRPISIRNPRTEAQQRHRSMFAEEVRLAGHMKWALGVGLKAVADEYHMTVQNAFVSLNQQAFSLEDGAFEVDWSQLKLSAGPIAPVELTEASIDGDNVLNVRFEPNPLKMRADRFDSVYIWVYYPELRSGYLAAPVYRMDKRVRASLPDGLVGKEVHVYGFAINKEGLASLTSYIKTDFEENEPEVQTTSPKGLQSTPPLSDVDEGVSISDSDSYTASKDETADIGAPGGTGIVEDTDNRGGDGQYQLPFG